MAFLIALLLLLPAVLMVSLIVATLRAVSRHEARMAKLHLAPASTAVEPLSADAQPALQECVA